jgi:endoglucanase
MKTVSTFLFIIIIAVTSQSIHINQLGYYPYAKKVATINDSTVKTFKIVDTLTKETVFSGPVIMCGYDKTANETISIADFTLLNKTGTYRCITDTKDSSYYFSIQNTCYTDAVKKLTKSYYYLRSGIPLFQEFAGQWQRGAGHLSDSSLTVYDVKRDSVFDVRGGWYDAGDFGKYVVCAGITCGTLLGLYELCPDAIGDSSLNIPESNNGRSDLLDEVKYEIVWMSRMQDRDGGVFFKVGPVKWYGDIMPEDDVSKRYIIGKSTTSTLDFAAVAAMAGRVYRIYDSTFAKECLDRAERAWKWAIVNPKAVYPENTGGTGPYEDGSNTTYNDEFLWALSELAVTTKKPVYLDTLEKVILTRSVSSPAWWQNVNNLAFYSLAVNKVLSDSATNYIKDKILSFGDKTISIISKSPYRNPLQLNDYSWGSNATCGNYATGAVYAHYLSGNQKYLDAIIYTADYLFGRNPLNHCYVSGIGSDPTLSPHHRQSTADEIKSPVPGFVVGGANKNVDGADELLIEIVESGTPPAKCYIDDFGSYASNENAINQNAPWILTLAYLEKNANRNVASHVKQPNVKTNNKEPLVNVVSTINGITVHADRVLSSATIAVYALDGTCILKKSVQQCHELTIPKHQLKSSSSCIVTVQSISEKGSPFKKCFFIVNFRADI